MSNEAVCRTAPATPGLLNMNKGSEKAILVQETAIKLGIIVEITYYQYYPCDWGKQLNKLKKVTLLKNQCSIQ